MKRHLPDPEVDEAAQAFAGEAASYQRHPNQYRRTRPAPPPTDDPNAPIVYQVRYGTTARRIWQPWRIVVVLLPLAAVGVFAIGWWSVLWLLNHLL